VSRNFTAGLMRFGYVVLSYLLTPLVFLFLLKKGFSNRGYWDRLEERLGFGKARSTKPSIWVHAVSVGEVQAAAPLVRALMERMPGMPVVITTMTPTGSDRARALFGDTVMHSFVPYDLPGAVSRFFDRLNPRLAVIMETEIWPNLYHECGRRRIPLVMANARVSEKSVKKYKLMVELFRRTLSHGIVIAAQSQQDASRFLSIGSNPARTHVVGNIKFGFELSEELAEQGRAFRNAFAPDRPVWLAASTHAGEEELVLEAHARVQSRSPRSLLILVPRHPERFDGIAAMVKQAGLSCRRRSLAETPEESTDVFLLDTLGELLMFYSASDVAFVGGSLVPIGGHNLLEPASLGVPVIVGPHNFNAQDVTDLFLAAQAMRVVEGPAGLAGQVVALFEDAAARQELAAAAFAVLDQNRGTVDRLLGLLEPMLLERFPDAS
jgi:3-deoxy-D-manno-octulosonic-acid transferase